MLAESKYPTSPGYPAHKTFGVAPSAGTPAMPSIFSATADSSNGGGDAGADAADAHRRPTCRSLRPLTKELNGVLGIKQSSASLVDVGNISANTSMTLGDSTITATSTSTDSGVDVAGLVDIASLTSTATASSDGTTGTPTASLHLGQVTVDGQQAYIDDKGVHIPTTNPSVAGITPQQLQQTVDATLAQDGISIRVLDPKLTTSGAAATADAGGLQIAISHQIDVPFIPGEPTIPVPGLGNVGLPAGLYTATTSVTFGLAQSSVAASGLSGQIGVLPSTEPTDNVGGSSSGFPDTLGSTFSGGSVQSLPATGPGSAAGSGVAQSAAPTTASAFPIRGVPAPVGWVVAALLACVLFAYPLLLLISPLAVHEAEARSG